MKTRRTSSLAGSRQTPHRFRRRLVPALIAAAFAGLPYAAAALPTGEQLISGQAVVSRPDASSLRVDQTSDRAIIEWQNFGLGSAERAQFIQPSANSMILNRIVGGNPSEIAGRIEANGRVLLVNPNGVYFSQGASVDVGGMIASTLNITNENFLRNQFVFEGAGGTIQNNGSLSAAPGGFIALLANQISNAGVIRAPEGSVGLVAAGRVLLDFDRDGLMSFDVSVPAALAKITHTGSITADGGRVALEARVKDALQSTVINSEGVIRARGLTQRSGKIYLDGGESGIVDVSGTLDAGSSAAVGNGGEVRLLGDDVRLTGNAQVNASGASGGIVLIGGDLRGQNPLVRNATDTSIAGNVTIRADADGTGDGGRVVVWANNAMRFAGTITARGGVESGNGGFVETSGGRSLSFPGYVDVGAYRGTPGEWLIDPVEVRSACPGPTNVSCITYGQLNTALGGGSLPSPSIEGVSIANDTITVLANNSNLTLFPQGTNDVLLIGARSLKLEASGTNNLIVNAPTGNSPNQPISFQRSGTGAGTVDLVGNQIDLNNAVAVTGNVTITLIARANGIRATAALRGAAGTGGSPTLNLTSTGGSVGVSSPVDISGAFSNVNVPTSTNVFLSYAKINNSDALKLGNSLATGTINVRATDADIQVVGALSAPTISLSATGAGTLTIGASGTLTANGSSTAITLTTVDGNLNVSGTVQSAGSTTNNNVITNTGAVTIQSTNGAISLSSNVTASAQLTASGKSIDVSGALSAPTISLSATGAGTLTIGASGTLTATGSITAINLTTVDGKLNVSGAVQSTGSTNTNNVITNTGEATIRTTAGDISFANTVAASNRITVSSTKGSISASGSASKLTATKFSLETREGDVGSTTTPIPLDGPAGSSLVIDGAYGKNVYLESAFSGSTLLETTVIGALGTVPSGIFYVKTSQGGITLPASIPQRAVSSDNIYLVSNKEVSLNANTIRRSSGSTGSGAIGTLYLQQESGFDNASLTTIENALVASATIDHLGLKSTTGDIGKAGDIGTAAAPLGIPDYVRSITLSGKNVYAIRADASDLKLTTITLPGPSPEKVNNGAFDPAGIYRLDVSGSISSAESASIDSPNVVLAAGRSIGAATDILLTPDGWTATKSTAAGPIQVTWTGIGESMNVTATGHSVYLRTPDSFTKTLTLSDHTRSGQIQPYKNKATNTNGISGVFAVYVPNGTINVGKEDPNKPDQVVLQADHIELIGKDVAFPGTIQKGEGSPDNFEAGSLYVEKLAQNSAFDLTQPNALRKGLGIDGTPTWFQHLGLRADGGVKIDGAMLSQSTIQFLTAQSVSGDVSISIGSNRSVGITLEPFSSKLGNSIRKDDTHTRGATANTANGRFDFESESRVVNVTILGTVSGKDVSVSSGQDLIGTGTLQGDNSSIGIASRNIDTIGAGANSSATLDAGGSITDSSATAGTAVLTAGAAIDGSIAAGGAAALTAGSSIRTSKALATTTARVNAGTYIESSEAQGATIELKAGRHIGALNSRVETSSPSEGGNTNLLLEAGDSAFVRHSNGNVVLDVASKVGSATTGALETMALDVVEGSLSGGIAYADRAALFAKNDIGSVTIENSKVTAMTPFALTDVGQVAAHSSDGSVFLRKESGDLTLADVSAGASAGGDPLVNSAAKYFVARAAAGTLAVNGSVSAQHHRLIGKEITFFETLKAIGATHSVYLEKIDGSFENLSFVFDQSKLDRLGLVTTNGSIGTLIASPLTVSGSNELTLTARAKNVYVSADTRSVRIRDFGFEDGVPTLGQLQDGTYKANPIADYRRNASTASSGDPGDGTYFLRAADIQRVQNDDKSRNTVAARTLVLRAVTGDIGGTADTWAPLIFLSPVSDTDTNPSTTLTAQAEGAVRLEQTVGSVTIADASDFANVSKGHEQSDQSEYLLETGGNISRQGTVKADRIVLVAGANVVALISPYIETSIRLTATAGGNVSLVQTQGTAVITDFSRGSLSSSNRAGGDFYELDVPGNIFRAPSSSDDRNLVTSNAIALRAVNNIGTASDLALEAVMVSSRDGSEGKIALMADAGENSFVQVRRGSVVLDNSAVPTRGNRAGQLYYLDAKSKIGSSQTVASITRGASTGESANLIETQRLVLQAKTSIGTGPNDVLGEPTTDTLSPVMYRSGSSGFTTLTASAPQVWLSQRSGSTTLSDYGRHGVMLTNGLSESIANSLYYLVIEAGSLSRASADVWADPVSAHRVILRASGDIGTIERPIAVVSGLDVDQAEYTFNAGGLVRVDRYGNAKLRSYDTAPSSEDKKTVVNAAGKGKMFDFRAGYRDEHSVGDVFVADDVQATDGTIRLVASGSLTGGIAKAANVYLHAGTFIGKNGLVGTNNEKGYFELRSFNVPSVGADIQIGVPLKDRIDSNKDAFRVDVGNLVFSSGQDTFVYNGSASLNVSGVAGFTGVPNTTTTRDVVLESSGSVTVGTMKDLLSESEWPLPGASHELVGIEARTITLVAPRVNGGSAGSLKPSGTDQSIASLSFITRNGEGSFPGNSSTAPIKVDLPGAVTVFVDPPNASYSAVSLANADGSAARISVLNALPATESTGVVGDGRKVCLTGKGCFQVSDVDVVTSQAIAAQSKELQKASNPTENATQVVEKGMVTKAGPGQPAITNSLGLALPTSCESANFAAGAIVCQ